MVEILDDFRKRKVVEPIFSILSFILAIATLVLCLITFSKILSSSYLGNSGEKEIGYVIAIWTTVLVGNICSVVSIVRKERLKYFKKIGMFLNASVLVIIVGLVIYAWVLDTNY